MYESQTTKRPTSLVSVIIIIIIVVFGVHYVFAIIFDIFDVKINCFIFKIIFSVYP